MTVARVNIFGAALLACFVALCGTAQGQTLSVRQLAVTTAVENASIPASAPLRWYQGESLVFRHYSTQGGSNANWGSLSNLVAIWSLTANQTEDPANTNAYLYSTGTVTAASGLVSFAVSPEMSAMPASNYWSYVTLYQTDESGQTNNYIGVLHRSAAVVGYRMLHPVYTGPYPIPTNGCMADTVARALAASNTALIVAETNRAIQAEAGINTTATNALAIANDAHGWGNHATSGYMVIGPNINFADGGITAFSVGQTNLVGVYPYFMHASETGLLYSAYGNSFQFTFSEDFGAFLIQSTRSGESVPGISFGNSFLLYDTHGEVGDVLVSMGAGFSPAWTNSPNIYTNGTGYGDGVLNGTNGVYWTKNGTNYWILLD